MTDSSSCPCNGSGTITIELPSPGAVTSTELLCPEHGMTLRRVVRDAATDKVGEIVDRLTKDHRQAVWLRMANGIEFTAFVDDLRVAATEDGATA